MSFPQFLGDLTTNTSTVRVPSKQGSTVATLSQAMTVATGSTDTKPHTSEVVSLGQGQNNSHSKTTVLQVATTSASGVLTTAQEVGRTSANATNQLSKTALLGRNTANTTMQQSPRTGKRQDFVFSS